eukprot:GFYU01017692.1.p1 GENE.GFYU01017692.1~~GFYU01017692.1.p1  ORF type:complete len:459 (-),score=125.82 GFYU01017692.1:119-1438(-)
MRSNGSLAPIRASSVSPTSGLKRRKDSAVNTSNQWTEHFPTTIRGVVEEEVSDDDSEEGVDIAFKGTTKQARVRGQQLRKYRELDSDWGELLSWDMRKADDEKRMLQQKKMENQKQLRKELDRHVQEKKQQRRKEHQDEMDYYHFEQGLVKQELEKQRQNQLERDRKARETEAMLASQVKHRHKVLTDEKKAQRKYELNLLKEVANAEKQEELRQLEKKKEDEQLVAYLRSANTELLAAREEQRKQEMNLDKRLLAEMIEREEKEEKKRKDALQKLFDDQERRMKLGERFQGELQRKLAEEQRIQEFQEAEIKARQEESLQVKLKKQAEVRQQMQETLKFQLKERDKRRREDQELLEEIGALSRMKDDEFNSKQAQLKRERLKRNVQYSKDLKEQMDRNIFRHLTEYYMTPAMTPHERALNAKMIEEMSAEMSKSLDNH